MFLFIVSYKLPIKVYYNYTNSDKFRQIQKQNATRI